MPLRACYPLLFGVWLSLGVGPSAAAAQPAAPWQLEATLEHAAFDLDGAPSVIVHAAAGFDPNRPLRLVVFLHGYSGCVRVLLGSGRSYCRDRSGERAQRGFGLARAHAAWGGNALLVVPQLAYMKRNGAPGRFGQSDGFRRFLQELLAGPLSRKLGRDYKLSDVESISLIAHSAGFQTALAVLDHGGLDRRIRQVVLLDALYDGVERFARWLLDDREGASDRKLVNVHLRGKPAAHSARLRRRVSRALGAARAPRIDGDGFIDAVRDPNAALITIRGRGAHRDLPERYLKPMLQALMP